MRTYKTLAGCLLLFTSACSKPDPPEEAGPAPVQVATVTQETMRRIISGDGVLFARDQASVTPKISAPVQKFYVNRGDHVKAGQLLAVLENRDLIAAANESKSAVAQAESNFRAMQGASIPESIVKAQTDVDAARQALDAAKKVLDSREQLFKEGALPRRQVDEARVAYAQANGQFRAVEEHLRTLQSVAKDEQIKGAAAQVDSAKSHHQSLEAQVSYSQIISPISGVVADRPIYAGEMATPGNPLLTVMDISRVVARVNIPQAQAGKIRVGQGATITQTDSQLELNGKVTVVSPATDSNSTTIQIWIEADNPGERLKPGTGVHAEVIAETLKDVTVIPAAAVLPGEEGGSAVLTVSADSTAHRKEVKLGVREGDKIQVLSGVDPGEKVVIVGGMGVDDKAKVKIADAAAKKGDDEDTKEKKPADK